MNRIRIATYEDYDECRHREYSYVEDHLLKQSIQNEWVYLSEINGKVVGYARLEFIWLKIPYLSLIWFEDAFQGQGLGTKLIHRISEDLSNKGYTSLYSSSEVMEPKPQQFHRKCGFKECGIISGINDDEVGEIFFVKELGKLKE